MTAARVRTPERAEFLSSLITTAVEGGVNYWAAAEEYRWFDPDLEGGTAEPGPGGTANAWAVLVPDWPERYGQDWPALDGGPRFRLDMDAMARAVARVVAGGVEGISDTGPWRRMVTVCDRHNGRDVDGAEYWAGDLDADVADALAQVAVFGAVIYG